MALLIIIVAVLGFLVPSISLEKICSSKECAKIAEEYLLNMDTSVNPCDDFYKFVCGKYASNNPIPEGTSYVKLVTKLQGLTDTRVANQLIELLKEPIQKNEAKHLQSVKKYYNSCMNTDRIEEIGLKEVKKILETLGGWPVVEDLNPDVDWESVLYGLSKKYLEANALITVMVEQDYKNGTKRILSIFTPIISDFVKRGKSDETMKAYYDLMVQTAIAFGAKEETAKQDMDLALNFEIYLAKKMKSAKATTTTLADLKAAYNLYTIKQLEMEFPGFKWSNYMENVIPKYLKIASNTEIMVTEPEYIKSFTEILKDTPARVIRNYIIWKALEKMLPYLNKEVQDLNLKFEEVLEGTTKPFPRTVDCHMLIKAEFADIVSALYIRKYFDVVSKTKALEVVNLIIDQFEQTLNNTKWPEQDKAKAIEKIKSLHKMVGFPNFLLDDEKLDSFYKTLEINEDNFLQNTLNLKKFKTNLLYRSLVNKSDLSYYWMFTPEHVNAGYRPQDNELVIPAGISQGNFFNAKFPQYINFAGIGFLIAHELSHGFDRDGLQFNKDGSLENWLSNITEEYFAEKRRCLVEQFNNFTLHGEKINGALTVDENLADVGGQKISYLSYQNWRSRNNEEPGLPGLNYTNNQLFWIASANDWCENMEEKYMKYFIETAEHSPSQFRINGPKRNLEMFSKDFNCPVGSNMNPNQKCTVW